jgi:RecB family endonuclease NucS
MRYPVNKIFSETITALRDQLNHYIKKRMIILFGKCSSLFDGRIKSSLNEGDRLLVIKTDETIILHNPIGLKPIQWQKPSVGKVNFTINDSNQLKMETYRPKTDETFFITFSKVYSAFTFDTKEEDDSALIFGDEKDFIVYLVNHPDTIEEGLKVLDSEKESEVGFIDIYANDAQGKHVIIEVKKQIATPADAFQLKRYVDYYQNHIKKHVRGILVAASIPKRVENQLKSYKLESVAIPWRTIFPTIKRPSSVLRSKNLEEFFEDD